MSASSSWNLTVILKSSTAPWASSWSPGITCPLGQQKPRLSQWAWPCTAHRRLWTSWSEWLRCDPDLQRQHGHQDNYSRAQANQARSTSKGQIRPSSQHFGGIRGKCLSTPKGCALEVAPRKICGAQMGFAEVRDKPESQLVKLKTCALYELF